MNAKRRSKTILKRVIDSICVLIVLPFFIVQWVLEMLIRRDVSFSALSQFWSLVPGLAGSYLRKNYYRLAMNRCDKDCAILFGTIFSHANTEIGKGVYIGAYCNIGKCKIDNYCTIGSNVHIMSGKHQHSFNDLDTPVQEQGGVFEKVVIGEDTWIGNCALIMANIGKKCIVGAGSVVTKNVEDFSIVAGNPAKMIRKRKENGQQ